MKIIRLLIYDGPSSWIEHTKSHDAVKYKRNLSDSASITSVYLGQLPDALDILLRDLRDKTEGDEE